MLRRAFTRQFAVILKPPAHIQQGADEQRQAQQHFQPAEQCPVRDEGGLYTADEIQVYHEADPGMSAGTAQQYAWHQYQQRYQFDAENHPGARAMQLGE